jgi:hypothetical protein
VEMWPFNTASVNASPSLDPTEGLMAASTPLAIEARWPRRSRFHKDLTYHRLLLLHQSPPILALTIRPFHPRSRSVVASSAINFDRVSW